MEQAFYKLPDGWEWVQLGEVLDVRDGTHDSPKYVESGFPLVTSKNITGKGLDVQNVKYISKEDFDAINKRSKVDVGDILFAMIGTIGFPTVITDEPNYAIKNVALFKKRQDDQNMDFFKYFLESPYAIESMLAQAKGAAQKFVGLKVLRSFNVPLPPKVEQKRIVEKLDALLTRIDTAIDYLQESSTLADALSKNGLSEIFEGLKDSYEVVPLTSVVKINSGIALPKLFKNGFSDGDIPFFKVAQMNNHHENMVDPEITFNETVAKEHKIKLFPKGSTLIPKRGGAILTNKKRVLLEDASYDSNIMGLKADESKISDDYLFAFMRTIDLANFVDASTIPQVNNKHIDQMQIPLASIEEQADVVSRVNLLVKKLEVMNSEIQSQLDDLHALKSSILDSAFKGEL